MHTFACKECSSLRKIPAIHLPCFPEQVLCACQSEMQPVDGIECLCQRCLQAHVIASEVFVAGPKACRCGGRLQERAIAIIEKSIREAIESADTGLSALTGIAKERIRAISVNTTLSIGWVIHVFGPQAAMLTIGDKEIFRFEKPAVIATTIRDKGVECLRVTTLRKEHE